ncbi:M56 family metallopeptidase [Hymenobacter sp. H14-R3]|uniref:M56 family metallopeptidase n=1 Tax=Hymenobacter sp. H14-R3 TaxID=3046308 RepID=UPI0024B8D66E|nr:M56 family metallopeptidase [Hymenobacter sp. H14-R3]MDJ0366536.1 M56 family metallopeptidase [Hymenobacter sp. H14-R3]
MPTLDHLLAPALLRALGFTLLHSLWQGTGLGLGVGLLLWLLRGQAAVVRYRLAAMALATLVGLAAVTFAHYYQQAPAPAASTAAHFVSQPTYAALKLQKQAAGHALAAWPAALAYLEQHLAVGVALWLLGFTLMLGRLGLALSYVQRLRHRVSPVPEAWQQALARLVARAGLARPVALRASALVPSPLVIGYFTPVILLPLSVASGLRPAELEMVLAHELAHILRRDYLFNFLQTLAETVFFYHPAVWYLAAVLHAERENCCDDLAAQLGGNPRQLARALAALAALTAGAAPLPRLTLAAGGPRGSLLGRVRRLAYGQPAPTTGLWPATLALLLLSLGLGGLLHSAQATHRAGPVLTRTRNSATTKETPHDAPRTAHPALAASDDALQLLMQQQLEADGLLTNTDQYTIYLTTRKLLVNGKSQPAALLPRYQRLYEAATGRLMTPTTAYQTQNEVTYRVAPTPPPADPMRAALLRQLRRDGLVPAHARQLQVAVTKAGGLLLDGQAQSAARLAVYRPLLPLPPDSAGRTTSVLLNLDVR